MTIQRIVYHLYMIVSIEHSKDLCTRAWKTDSPTAPERGSSPPFFTFFLPSSRSWLGCHVANQICTVFNDSEASWHIYIRYSTLTRLYTPVHLYILLYSVCFYQFFIYISWIFWFFGFVADWRCLQTLDWLTEIPETTQVVSLRVECGDSSFSGLARPRPLVEPQPRSQTAWAVHFTSNKIGMKSDGSRMLILPWTSTLLVYLSWRLWWILVLFDQALPEEHVQNLRKALAWRVLLGVSGPVSWNVGILGTMNGSHDVKLWTTKTSPSMSSRIRKSITVRFHSAIIQAIQVSECSNNLCRTLWPCLDRFSSWPHGSFKLKGQHCPVNPSRTRLPLIDCFEAELDFQGVLTSDTSLSIQVTFPQRVLWISLVVSAVFCCSHLWLQYRLHK